MVRVTSKAFAQGASEWGFTKKVFQNSLEKELFSKSESSFINHIGLYL